MDHLEHGRASYGRRAWKEAYRALFCADQATPLAVDDLDRLATAAYLAGHDHEFQQLIERLYRVHVESGDRPRAALDPLRCAFELWRRLDAPYEAARVRVLIGDVCRALGDYEAAGLELEAAKAVFERLGARPDLARLEAPKCPAGPVSSHPLTGRELHVLRLIATGRTNGEVAEELHLSERTIDRHVTNILTKLDVRSRTAATAYAYDHNLF